MAGLPSAARGGRVTGSLVDGVDHVYVPMADASAAFAVLADQLALPVLWPFTSFGTFSSGGVSVGSIKLEVIEPGATAPWSTAAPAVWERRVVGFLDSQLQPS